MPKEKRSRFVLCGVIFRRKRGLIYYVRLDNVASIYLANSV